MLLSCTLYKTPIQSSWKLSYVLSLLPINQCVFQTYIFEFYLVLSLLLCVSCLVCYVVELFLMIVWITQRLKNVVLYWILCYSIYNMMLMQLKPLFPSKFASWQQLLGLSFCLSLFQCSLITIRLYTFLLWYLFFSLLVLVPFYVYEL